MKKYRSLNEPNGFYYHDAELLNVSVVGKDFVWDSKWITVIPENSLSEYDSDMRTENITITFENYKVEKVVKYGSKHYSSSGEVLEELPDIELNENEIIEFLDEMKGCKEWCARFFAATGKMSDDRVIFEADMDFESYPYPVVFFVISCDKFIVEWDEYVNKQDCDE